MKVLMFGWEFPPYLTGGLGTACFGLTKALSANDIDLTFVMPKAETGLYTEHLQMLSASEVYINQLELETKLRETFHSINFIHLDYNVIPYINSEEYSTLISTVNSLPISFQDHSTKETPIGKYAFQGGYGSNLRDEVYRYSLAAAEIARTEKFDVIHSHDWLTYGAGLMAKEISGKPLVLHIHATEFDRNGEDINTIVYNIEQSSMLRADKVIAVSNLTRDIVINRYHIPADKVVTVHNGIDLEDVDKKESKESNGLDSLKDLKKSQEITTDSEDASFMSKLSHPIFTNNKKMRTKMVTFLGRITYQKGTDYFIDAAYKVIQREPNVRFILAGTGDKLPNCIAKITALQIAKYFYFTGFVTKEEVHKIFGASDVYVMPSVSEPFGITPLEAINQNVPTIISKQSGVGEVLSSAIKLDFWDTDALADAIYGIIKYDTISHQIRKQAIVEARGITWDKAAKEIISVYESLLY